jgi:DNA-binding PadR family transcriptional regulator
MLIAMKMPSNTELGLLVALGPHRLSGRDLAKRYKEETCKSISYGTLYTTMSRLQEQRWVEHDDTEDADGRVRFFRLTGDGVSAINEARSFYAQLLGLSIA